MKKRKAWLPACLWMGIIFMMSAATDEIHQAFVPDRGPSPVDVMIDTAGASVGLVLSLAVSRIRNCKPTT